MQDHELRQQVLDELEFEPSIDANDIGVTVENGVVGLSGHVRSYDEKLTVERVVAGVKGVRGVAEHIEVRPPGSYGASDDELARRALDTLKWSTMVPDQKVQVRVEDGWITLTGTLDWNYQRTGAVNALRGLKGVTGITNGIELRPRVSSKDVKRHIEDALRRSADVEADEVHVNVFGNKVLLEGNVKSWNDRRVVERAAWATEGVTHVDDRLTVS